MNKTQLLEEFRKEYKMDFLLDQMDIDEVEAFLSKVYDAGEEKGYQMGVKATKEFYGELKKK